MPKGVIICDYLKIKGIVPDELQDLELPSTIKGIVPDELQDLELPSTVEIMRERVEFLQKLGLTIDDINEYPLMLGYSVRKHVIPVLAYLERIGIERSRLGEFVKLYPQCLHASVVVELVPVVKFLRGLDVEKDDKVVVRMLERRAYILGYDLEETVKLNVNCLLSFGISREALPSVIARYPQILGLPLKAKLSSQQYFFNLKLRIDPDGFACVIERMPQIVSLQQHVILKPIEFLLGRGFSVEDVAEMIIKCPQLLYKLAS
ncbi:hypothetical protein RND71_015688 [Anisodus tanguticus]|uniref:Uncharacterized protein n=1 Tax=Anisodus tanguticus TaxID=243964 RepID=A0AAE1VLB7_9SOLA|nr:hypothetical protein RND71_015688 [Anisodus tanguticus]